MIARNPLQIQPPSHFDRRSKAEFRRILATLSGSAAPVSAVDLADFVSLRKRIAWLERQFESDAYFAKDKRATARDLNAALAMSQKLADRLGLNAAPADGGGGAHAD